MRTSLRSRARAIALILVVVPLSLAATAAAGSQQSEPTPIPKSAFRQVSVPPLSGSSSPAATRPGDLADAGELGELRDIVLATTPPPRARPSIDPAKPIVVTVPPPAPRTTHAIRGNASYYCRAGSSPCTVDHPDRSGVQAFAAAGPRLRAAMGSGWRDSIVYVDGIRVKLIDWCQCYKGESNEKLLDLYYDVFSRTGSPVVVRW